jgi:hypothetical protein
MKERDEIEDLFSSAFGDFEKMPPIDVKAAIDDQLFKTTAKKRKIGFIWILPAALLLVGGLWIGYNSFDDANDKSKPVAAKADGQVSSFNGNSVQQASEKESGIDLNVVKNVTESDDKTITRNQKNEQLHKEDPASETTSLRNTPQVLKGSKRSERMVQPVQKQTVASIDKNTSDGSLHSNVSEPTEQKVAETTNSGLEAASETKNDEKEVINETVPGSDVAKNDQEKSEATATKQPESPEVTPALTSSIPQKNKKNWSLSLLAGPTYGSSKLNQPDSIEFFMKEEIGFAVGVESTFMLGQNWGITTGLDINKRTDVLNRMGYETVYLGQGYDYIYDPQVTDSVIDSILVDLYGPSEQSYKQTQFINHFSIAVPFYFTKYFALGKKLGMEVNGGLRFSYVSNKLSMNFYSLPEPKFKSVGIRVSLRPQLIYMLDNGIGIGGYVNAGYDLIPAISWDNIKRSRLDLGGGVLLRYSF